LWKAVSDKKIEKGKKVRILDAEGLTLKVEEV
ncbi:MAG: NfeD family protein, partial [Hydrogenothermaceae bacterium]